MIFVSSPYSHKDKQVIKNRVEKVSQFCSKLLKENIHAFSPIIYKHLIVEKDGIPDDWSFWEIFCKEMILKSDMIYVLKFEGWEQSTGLKAEIEFAKQNNIPIYYFE